MNARLAVAIRVAFLTGAFALGTGAFGWAAVPLIAAAWGALDGDAGDSALMAAGGAALSWGALLVWTAFAGPLGTLAAGLGAVTGLPGFLWIVATVLFPAALAWSASLLGSAVVQAVRSRKERANAGTTVGGA